MPFVLRKRVFKFAKLSPNIRFPSFIWQSQALQLTCRFFITENIPFGNEESLFLASRSSSRDVKLSKHPVSRETIRFPLRFNFLKLKKICLEQVHKGGDLNTGQQNQQQHLNTSYINWQNIDARQDLRFLENCHLYLQKCGI